MNRKYLTLISRIEKELSELEKIIVRSQKAWKQSQVSNDDLYLDSVALNLHAFYSGLERIFELIANNIDQSVPEGESWHQDLLKQMLIEIKKIRPAVISQDTYNQLDEYRGFRHIVRNVYTFKLSQKRLKPLINDLPTTFNQVKNEIQSFMVILKKQTRMDNNS